MRSKDLVKQEIGNHKVYMIVLKDSVFVYISETGNYFLGNHGKNALVFSI